MEPTNLFVVKQAVFKAKLAWHAISALHNSNSNVCESYDDATSHQPPMDHIYNENLTNDMCECVHCVLDFRLGFLNRLSLDISQDIQHTVMMEQARNTPISDAVVEKVMDKMHQLQIIIDEFKKDLQDTDYTHVFNIVCRCIERANSDYINRRAE